MFGIEVFTDEIEINHISLNWDLLDFLSEVSGLEKFDLGSWVIDRLTSPNTMNIATHPSKNSWLTKFSNLP